MGSDQRYHRAPGWVWRNLRASVLVMGPDRVAHQLDGAAALVWRALDAPASASELAAGLDAELRGAHRPAGDLVGDAIAELVALGVIEADAAATVDETAGEGVP